MRACLLLLASTLAAQTISVSPTGPVKTLAEARDAARDQRRGGKKGNITIRIDDGDYFLRRLWPSRRRIPTPRGKRRRARAR